MSADEQNNAIAIFLGKRPSCGQTPDLHAWGDAQYQARPVPFSFHKCTRCPAIHIEGERFVSIGSGDEVPEYTSSLDAMHEAEKTLTGNAKTRFDNHLYQLCGSWSAAIHATPDQRAQAFLLATSPLPTK